MIFINEKMDAPGAARHFLAAAEQGEVAAQMILADCSETGKGILEKSLENALYWYREAAGQGSTHGIGKGGGILLKIAEAKYGGLPGISRAVGDCALPEALYWMRKALAAEPVSGTYCLEPELRDNVATNVMIIESYIGGQCGNCGSSGSSPLRKCLECKGAAYCNRMCQRDHWRKGHKWDCCNKDGVKLIKPRSSSLGHSQPALSGSGLLAASTGWQPSLHGFAFRCMALPADQQVVSVGVCGALCLLVMYYGFVLLSRAR